MAIRISERLNRLKVLLADTRGQALIETAIFCSIFVFMASLVADAAWMAWGAGVTSSAARSMAVLAAQGQQSLKGTPVQNSALSGKCNVANNEMSGWTAYTVNAAATGLNGTSWANTASCGASNSYVKQVSFQADPESAYFSINAVQVNTQFKPPLNFSVFGIKALSIPSVLYGRPVYFRQVN